MSETTFATALDSLGEILAADPGRDAIHLATFAVVAAERLFPGQHIGIIEGNSAGPKAAILLGIVDPFLKVTVFPGQMFWMVLYPRTITSLRHVWTHPAFAIETAAGISIPGDKEVSEAWLKSFLESSDTPGYDITMAALRGEWPPAGSDTSLGVGDDYVNFQWGGWDGESLHFGSVDAHSEIPPEFWTHVSVVLGQTIPTEKRAKHFTCSC